MSKTTARSPQAEAPAGASLSGVPEYPAISINGSGQGSTGEIDASPTRIARMLRTIFQKEKEIRAWEDMTKSDGKRFVMGDNGKLKWVPVAELVGDSLTEARESRDQHLAEVRHLIDYALTTEAYEDVPCPSCKLPKAPLAFIRQVADYEPPAIQCNRCIGLGTVRLKKAGKRAAAKFKRVSYFKKVLDDTVRCSKVRMGTSDSEEAYVALEDANRGLISKFGNEKQTSLEGDDAEQGVRQGLIDAAMRFDPTRKEGATYNTVAYNWCYRNSRARQKGQSRAGLCGRNLGEMGGEDEGNMEALVTESIGAIGTTRASRSNAHLTIDLRDSLQELPPLAREIVTGELEGKTVSQLAKQMKISKAKIRKLREGAFSLLRDLLSGYVDVVCD